MERVSWFELSAPALEVAGSSARSLEQGDFSFTDELGKAIEAASGRELFRGRQVALSPVGPDAEATESDNDSLRTFDLLTEPPLLPQPTILERKIPETAGGPEDSPAGDAVEGVEAPDRRGDAHVVTAVAETSESVNLFFDGSPAPRSNHTLVAALLERVAPAATPRSEPPARTLGAAGGPGSTPHATPPELPAETGARVPASESRQGVSSSADGSVHYRLQGERPARARFQEIGVAPPESHRLSVEAPRGESAARPPATNADGPRLEGAPSPLPMKSVVVGRVFRGSVPGEGPPIESTAVPQPPRSLAGSVASDESVPAEAIKVESAALPPLRSVASRVAVEERAPAESHPFGRTAAPPLVRSSTGSGASDARTSAAPIEVTSASLPPSRSVASSVPVEERVPAEGPRFERRAAPPPMRSNAGNVALDERVPAGGLERDAPAPEEPLPLTLPRATRSEDAISTASLPPREVPLVEEATGRGPLRRSTLEPPPLASGLEPRARGGEDTARAETGERPSSQGGLETIAQGSPRPGSPSLHAPILQGSSDHGVPSAPAPASASHATGPAPKEHLSGAGSSAQPEAPGELAARSPFDGEAIARPRPPVSQVVLRVPDPIQAGSGHDANAAIRVRLRLEGTAVDARFSAESPEAGSLVSGSLRELREHLEHRGLDPRQLEVQYRGGSGRQPGDDRRPPRHAYRKPEDRVAVSFRDTVVTLAPES